MLPRFSPPPIFKAHKEKNNARYGFIFKIFRRGLSLSSLSYVRKNPKVVYRCGFFVPPPPLWASFFQMNITFFYWVPIEIEKVCCVPFDTLWHKKKSLRSNLSVSQQNPIFPCNTRISIENRLKIVFSKK